jgi:hypothetical protein
MSEIDISREAVAEIMRQGSLPLRGALIIPALRAALDAQAKVMVKPLVWTEYAPYWKACASDYEYSINLAADGVNFSVSTRVYVFGLNNAWCHVGGGYPSLHDAKAAAQADYDARIPSALEPTPLGEVAMRAAAVGAIIAEIKHAIELGAQHHVPVLAAVRRNIEAVTTTFTPAELLAAVEKVPEVKALVDAAYASMEPIKQLARNERLNDMDTPWIGELIAALAPFTRKGE